MINLTLYLEPGIDGSGGPTGNDNGEKTPPTPTIRINGIGDPLPPHGGGFSNYSEHPGPGMNRNALSTRLTTLRLAIY